MQLPKKLQPITESEILKEVSDELGINIKDVNKTYTIWLEFLNFIANETDQATIAFPHLGRMYVSTQKMRRNMHTEKLRKFKERKLKEIEKLESKYNIHKHCVPIILKYGISKKNSIPYILKKTDTTTFYTLNEIINNQTKIFFKEDIEFSERKELEKNFLRNDENN